VTTQGPTSEVFYGNDAMNKFIDVYMNAFASGMATAAVTLGYPVAAADEFADIACTQVRADPLAIEAIRVEIAETFMGTDSGPKSLTIPPVDGGDQ
jgi:hypothetical protein